MKRSELARALESLLAELEQLNVRYALGGSVASSFYGMPRATMDVDIAVELETEHAARFIAAVSDRYYAPQEQIRRAIANRTAFNLIDQETVIKIDVFVQGGDVYDRESMARRRPAGAGPARIGLSGAPLAQRASRRAATSVGQLSITSSW